MVGTRDSGNETAFGSEAAQDLASELIRGCGPDSTFDARAILREHPELDRHHSVVIDLAYEEYCRRLEAGEEIVAEQFAANFQGHRSSLLQVLKVHEYLDVEQRLQFRALEKWPLAGERFLGFQLVEEIGRGAFSRVFVATQPQLGNRHVVVKVCVNGGREAHVLGQLTHPHIVPVHSMEHDEQTGLTAICMPLLSRTTLFDVVRQLFDQGQAPLQGQRLLDVIQLTNKDEQRIERTAEDAAALRRLAAGSYVDAIVRQGIQLADALAYTHRRDLYHCDVKPSNVLLTPDGRAMLLDFNLAFGKQGEEENVGGTLPYMAPEQLRAIARTDQRPQVDARTDVFALGVTLYESLTGRLPFGALAEGLQRRRVAEQLLGRQQKGPPAIERINSAVDVELARVLKRCLAFAPQQRPENAEQLAAQLRSTLAATSRTRRWIRSRRRFLALTGGLAATATASLLAYLATREPYQVTQMRLGQTALAQQQYPTAAAHFANVLRIDSESVKARFLRGRALMLNKQYEQAEVEFRTLDRQLETKSGEVLACLAHCIATRAAEGIDDETREHEARDELEWKLAIIKVAMQDAIDLYREALESGAVSAAIHNNLAYCYGRRKRFREAELEYRRSLQFDSPPIAAFLNLARTDRRLALKDKRVPDVRLITCALEEAPSSARIHLDAACIFALAAQRQLEGTFLDKTDFLTLAISTSQRGVELGFTAKDLRRIATYCPLLDELEDFKSLKARCSEAGWTEDIAPMVDPLIGISARPY